ncbi:hypothetical protein [Rhodococcus sp. IEGM 1307]|uniref:hypothetical protein n=1 Tax=Rhodococcus sp. IEGM 1307 TaxID=3047091 RepID=UPI0024B6CB1C|nr:hypothetical protein [Rhodococcus sp. IEGM 1307]MDI9978799.1 hypothetical protein [Rhodococcus sp. IEGM 1307]
MNDHVVRVRFTEGQFLGADDLLEEQAYRENAERRHRLGGHSWGIVSGLQLAHSGRAFSVMPGVAIDGYGRAVAVTAPIRIEVDVDTRGQRDVWLSLESTSNRGDVATVCLTPADPDTLDPRHPVGVPPTDVASRPHSAVWSPPGPWPVYLGTVCWNDQSISTTADNRVCVGLRGEAVVAPSGRARMQIGAESSNDTTRFAVATEQVKATGNQATQDEVAHGKPFPLTTRLCVDATGNVSVCGTTTLGGDLVIHPPAKASADTHTGIKFAHTQEPVAASPWTLYRTRVVRQGRSVDQLRIEIAHPGDGGDPTRNRFIVGTRDASDESDVFHPCLTVNADCTVIAHDCIEVRGQLRRSPASVDRNDPRYAGAAVDGFVQGFTSAARGIAGVLTDIVLAVTVSSDDTPTQGENFSYAVTVTNSGSVAATSGQIYVTISIAEEDQPFKAQRFERLVANATFKPGVSGPQSGTFRVPPAAEGTLKVSAIALAVSPGANVVSATGEQPYDIVLAPPID